MSKKAQASIIVEFRFMHVWDDDVVPVERYFTAASSEEALDMFAYTCLKTGRKPILQEFAQWDRWRKSWIALPVPQRDEYVVAEEALSPDRETESKDPETEKPTTALS